MHHIVLLSFKDPAQAVPLFAALGRLKEIVPGMTSYSHGAYASPEGLHRGYTHAFVMAFVDAAARDRYLDHPEHEAVKNAFLPFVEQIVVFDFEG